MKGAILSLLLAFSFLALAFSPVTVPVRAEETDWGAIGGGAALGAVSGAAVGTLVADGPGALAGAVVGGLWGAISGYFYQDKSDAAAISGAIATYAANVRTLFNNYLTMAKTEAQNEIANYEAWSLYYARKAEWAALQLYQSQTENSTAHTYNPYYVLSRSEVANGTLAAAWHIAQTYEAILNSNKDLANSFVGTYEGMKWGYTQAGANTLHSRLTTLNPLVAKVVYELDWSGTSMPTNTKYVTLSVGSPLMLVNWGSTNIVNKTVTLTDRQGVVSYNETLTIPSRCMVLVNVPVSGEYNLRAPNSAIKAFAICGPAITSSYTLTPKILPFYKDGTSGALKMIVSDDEYYDLLGFFVESSGVLVPLTQIKTDMSAISSKVANMLTQANNFAQTYFNTLVSEGGGANRVMPDVVFPDPDVLANMTAEEIEAIYLAYMRSVQDWFGNYSVMNPANVNISQESLNLKVRGAIYYANGTLMYANTTIFTPYVSLEDMHLVVGNNTMTQPGFAVKWGSNASLAAFMAADRLTDVKYISLAVGDYFIIEEMMAGNETIASTDLTVHTVQYVTIGEDDLDPITPPQSATDAEWLMAHWYMIAVVLGALLVLAWVATRNTAIGAIGLLLLIAGGAFWYLTDSGSATGLLSGLFNIKGGP